VSLSFSAIYTYIDGKGDPMPQPRRYCACLWRGSEH